MNVLRMISSIFFILLVFGMLILYWFLPGQSVIFNIGQYYHDNFTLNNSALESMQFYSKMRFPNQNISYKIDNCTLQKKDNMERAFEILESVTILNFYPVESNEEISVTCDSQVKIKEGLFIAGEGGPTNITKTANFNVIFHGNILLIRDSKCPNPNVALHELLHVLGFDHSDNPKNIMYEISLCEQSIGKDIPLLINELYSLPTLTDLDFGNVSAFMHQRYLDLNMSIQNNGFKNSEKFTVTISTDGRKIKEIDFKALSVGHGIAIILKNIFVLDINIEEIELEINYPLEELEKNNNIIKLEIKK